VRPLKVKEDRLDSQAKINREVSYTICFKWPHKKKSQGFKSGDRAGDKTGQLRPIEEAIDKKCNSTWWIF
jgi:hypothetical protein